MISRKMAVFALIIPLLIPLATTGVSILQGPGYPEGISLQPPEEHDRVSEGILLIVLDGLPAYVMDNKEYMPTLASWTDYGAKATVSTSEITLTGPCTKEMSTGIHASPIDAMRNWAIQYDGKDDAFHYALERNMSVAFTGFYVWSNLYTDERFIHETVYDAGFSDIYVADDKIIANVENWIANDEHDLMVAHLGGTDHAGHMFGTESEKYKQKMLHLDNQLNSIRLSIPSTWTLMVTADHGMSESGGHAISTGDLAMKVNLLMSGAGVKTGATTEINQRDIASIPLTLLDLPFPISADSRIPLEMFDFDEEHANSLEQWNWEVQIKRQEWLEKNGYPFSEISQSNVEWDKLPSLTQSPSTWDIFASFIPLLGIGFLAFKTKTIRDFKQDNSLAIISVSVGFCAFIWAHYVWFYDIEFTTWTTKWIRKSVGILSVILVTSGIFYLTFLKSKGEDFSTPNIPDWSPYLMLAAVLWQPDSRLSPVLLVFATALILYLRKYGNTPKNKLNSYVFLIIILLPLWTIVSYYIGLIINIPIYELTGIDFFYKFWQQIVSTFFTENLLAALILGIIASYIADKITHGESDLQFLKLAIPVSIVIFLHSLGNSWYDRIIIAWIIFTITQSIFERIEHEYAVKSPFRAKWIELFGLSMIIPTWGVWPAVITLLIVRSTPIFVEENLEWLKEKNENNLLESCRLTVLAVIPFLLLCIIWTHYSLLTPMGLIEFNPSKIIVNGGFFGARTDPPIIWMVTMVTIPLVISCTMTVNTWSKAGFDLFPAIFLTIFLVVTNVSVMWMVLFRTQVLLMIGFSTIVYLFWVVCLYLGQHSLTALLNADSQE